MKIKRKKPGRLPVIRRVHFRTWTGNRAVPACDPTGTEKVSRHGQLSPYHDNVTCYDCKQRLMNEDMWPEFID